MSTAHPNQEFINGIKKMAAWMEARPELEINIAASGNIFTWTKPDFAEKAALFGSADKASDTTYYMLRKDFGGNVMIDLNVPHETVCERVQVGERVVPATEAIEAKPERIEPVFEWKCPDSIFKPSVEPFVYPAPSEVA